MSVNEIVIKNEYIDKLFRRAESEYDKTVGSYNKLKGQIKIAKDFGYTGVSAGANSTKIRKEIKKWKKTLNADQLDLYEKALWQWRDDGKGEVLDKFWKKINGMNVHELDKLTANHIHFSHHDNDFYFSDKLSTRSDFDPSSPLKRSDKDPLSPEGIDDYNWSVDRMEDQIDTNKPIGAGIFSKQKEHLDPVSWSGPRYQDNLTQQRTRTGLFGLGTERKLYEKDGKYYTTLSFVKGGNRPEGPEYWFDGGKEKEISYERYKDLHRKMKNRRLKNISRND